MALIQQDKTDIKMGGIGWSSLTVSQPPWVPPAPPPQLQRTLGVGLSQQFEFSNTRKRWVRDTEYAKKRNAGTLTMNSYLRDEQVRQAVTVIYNHTVRYGTNGWSRTSGTARTVTPYPGNQSLISDQELANKVLAKSREQKWSAPVFAGEARETVKLVTSTATRLYRVLKALRRGDLRQAYGVLNMPADRSDVRAFNRAYGTSPIDTAANAWMEGRYGWRPLLHDVEDMAEALAHTVSHQDSGNRTVFVVLRKSSETLGPVVNTNIYGFPIRYRVLQKYKTAAKAILKVKPVPGWRPTWYGLDNPFEVAWELIPFSFVADWFLPIGDYISALSFTTNFTFSEYGVGRLIENQASWQDLGVGSEYGAIAGGSATREIKDFRPLGAPSAGISPKLKCELDWPKAVDSLVLLRQQLQRLGRG